MGRFNVILNWGLDPIAAYLWCMILGMGFAVGGSSIAAYFLAQSQRDWRREYMYKPDYAYQMSLGLLASRLSYLLIVPIIIGDSRVADVDSPLCVVQGIITQFMDIYVLLMLLGTVVSNSRDAVTVMIEYPEELVTKEQLNQLLRLSTGGALGFKLDAEKLREGIVAARPPQMESSSDSDESDKSDEEEKKEKDLKDISFDTLREQIAAQEMQTGETGGTGFTGMTGTFAQVPGNTSTEQPTETGTVAEGPAETGGTAEQPAEEDPEEAARRAEALRARARRRLSRDLSEDPAFLAAQQAAAEQEQREEEERALQNQSDHDSNGGQEDQRPLLVEDVSVSEQKEEPEQPQQQSKEQVQQQPTAERHSGSGSDRSLTESEEETEKEDKDEEEDEDEEEEEEDAASASSKDELNVDDGKSETESESDNSDNDHEKEDKKSPQPLVPLAEPAGVASSDYADTLMTQDTYANSSDTGDASLGKRSSSKAARPAGRAAPNSTPAVPALSAIAESAGEAASSAASSDVPLVATGAGTVLSQDMASAEEVVQADESEDEDSDSDLNVAAGGKLRGGARHDRAESAASAGSGMTGVTGTSDVTGSGDSEELSGSDEYDSMEDSYYSDEDDLWESDSESEISETSSSDEPQAGSATKEMALGFFGFFCGGSDVPAAQESRAERRKREMELKARAMGLDPDKDFEHLSRAASRRMSRQLSRAGSFSGDGGSDMGSGGGRRRKLVKIVKQSAEKKEIELRPGGLLTLSYPARIAEMMRSTVSKPILLLASTHLSKGYLRDQSTWECHWARDFITHRVRREGTIKPAREQVVGASTRLTILFIAGILSLFPLSSGSYGFIGFACGIQESSNAGLAWLLLLSYGPVWFILFISQVLHFFLRLLKTYSYPATANGPHQVEVAIRRLMWYPTTMAAAYIFPTAHAWFFHQHFTLAQFDSYVAMAALLHMWGVEAVNVLFAVGVVMVEIHIGKRDRYIVRSDPLSAKPVGKDNDNLEELPANMKMSLMRDRFYLLMNALEERKHMTGTADCVRCNLHSHRHHVKNAEALYYEALRLKEAQMAEEIL